MITPQRRRRPGPAPLLKQRAAPASHLLIVVLGREEVVHNGDPVAQLLAQGIQEAVRVPAAWRAGKGEELLPPGEGAERVVRVLGGERGAAVQADVGIGLGAARGREAALRVEVAGLGCRQRGAVPGDGHACLPGACGRQKGADRFP